MTNQHPLTDEICDKIQDSVYPCDPEDMRVAADWQLEQVIDWLNATIFEQSMWSHEIENLPKELEKAMRPQQHENN